MALGELTKCWICYESKRYGNPNFKQLCTPIRGEKGTIVQGMAIWLCKDCKTNI